MSANFTPEQKNYNDYKTFEPFKMFVQQNFPFIAEDFDSLTYYQMLCKVVEYLKDTIDNNKLIQENQNEVLNAYNQLQEYVNTYFDNLDVQNEINNKLDEMATTGVLQEFISTFFNDVRKEFNTRLDNQNTALINTQNDVNTLESRMNTFSSLPEGSTTGDAELTDVRVAYDGAKYPSAGESVRKQISNIHDLLGVDVYKLYEWGATQLKNDLDMYVVAGTKLYVKFRNVTGTILKCCLYGLKDDGNYSEIYKTTEVNKDIIAVPKQDFLGIRLYIQFSDENTHSGECIFGVVRDDQIFGHFPTIPNQISKIYKMLGADVYNLETWGTTQLKNDLEMYVPSGTKLYVNFTDIINGTLEHCFLYAFRHDGTYVSLFKTTELNHESIVTTEEDFVSIRLFMKLLTPNTDMTHSGTAIFGVVKDGQVFGSLQSQLPLTDSVVLNKKTAKIFKKVCCVGDSFTAGYMKNNGVVHDYNEDFAWPHYMATSTGNVYHNCGVSGANAKTWQENENGLAKAQAFGTCQAYIVGLALNDASNSERKLELGTIEDIGTELETYYAQYSKLIRELKAISPNAKIFVQTVPASSTHYDAYNTAIKDIANSYAETYDVHVLDLKNYLHLYTTDSITGDAKDGHYTAIGYQQFAENLEYIMSDYINNHITDFQNVAFI